MKRERNQLILDRSVFGDERERVVCWAGWLLYTDSTAILDRNIVKLSETIGGGGGHRLTDK